MIFPLDDCHAADSVDGAVEGITRRIKYMDNLDGVRFAGMWFDGNMNTAVDLLNEGTLDIVYDMTLAFHYKTLSWRGMTITYPTNQIYLHVIK